MAVYAPRTLLASTNKTLHCWQKLRTAHQQCGGNTRHRTAGRSANSPFLTKVVGGDRTIFVLHHCLQFEVHCIVGG